MEVLGAVLVTLSGLCLGLWKAEELRKREAALLDFKQTIQAFRTGVSYAARPLAELVRSNGESRFCRLAAEESCFSADPKTALQRAGERLLKDAADRELYRFFLRGLGESDIQGQLEHFSLCADMLEGSLNRAREDREKKSRLYVCVGLFGGITLCLVLV